MLESLNHPIANFDDRPGAGEDPFGTAALEVERWRCLAGAEHVLARGDDLRACVAEAILHLVPTVADCAVIALVRPGHEMPIIEIAHVDGSLHARRKLAERVLREAIGDIGGLIALAPGHAGDTAVGVALRAIIASLGAQSGAVMPILDENTTIGFVALGALSADADGEVIAELAHELAICTGSAIVHDRVGSAARVALAGHERVIRMLSHDLRNPLSTIQICAAALLDPTPPPADSVRETAELIRRSADWMEQLVQSFLNTSAPATRDPHTT
jgi:signal transduction histidine kinase